MILIGLTGSIGMGKSATSVMFQRHGVPAFDADAAVHHLYQGAAVEPVGALFPEAVVEGRIDRSILSTKVVGKPAAMKQLENIVHPLVRQSESAFLNAAVKAGATTILLDIPLLLESRAPRMVDLVVVVSAPADIQAERVLSRPGMTREKFEAILAKQMPDEQKRRRAHFIVESGKGFAHAERQVADILRATAGMVGTNLAKRLATHDAMTGNR